MDERLKQQANNGLRLGLGLGAFLVAFMLLSSGLRRMVALAPSGRFLAGTDWIGCGEVGLAVGLMMFTADIWFLLLGGWAFFAFLKSMIVLFTGRMLSPPHTALSRPEAAAIALLALATVALLVRFTENRPTILDRVALTLYVVALLWHGDIAEFSVAGPAVAVGLLAISWCVFRFKRTGSSEGGNAA